MKEDVLTTEVKNCIDEFIITRSKEIVIMRIELVNKLVDMNSNYEEYRELSIYLFNKYNVHYYELTHTKKDLLSTEDMNKLKIMNHKLGLRRRVEYRIDKLMKELNFSKEKVSMFVMYRKEVN